MSFIASKYLGKQKKKRSLKDKMRIKIYVCTKKIDKIFNKIKNILKNIFIFIAKNIIYRNVLTFALLLTLWATLFIIYNAVIMNIDNDRYTIKHNDGLTLLLDKKTGLVWRNVWNNNKDRIPSKWQLMDYSGSVVPEGEQEARNKRIQKNSKYKKYFF